MNALWFIIVLDSLTMDPLPGVRIDRNYETVYTDLDGTAYIPKELAKFQFISYESKQYYSIRYCISYSKINNLMKTTFNLSSQEQKFWRRKQNEDTIWMTIFLGLGFIIGLLFAGLL